MLTNKGKYGLKALVHLAGMQPGETAQSQDIAAANNIPKKFLDSILNELRVAGLVASRKGKGGGYRLAQDASMISVGTAVRILEGPLAPIACASRTAFRACQDCADLQACAVRALMLQVRDATAAILDGTSVRDMRHQLDRGGAAILYHI
jgi:Rrf2 family protein